MIHGDCSSRGCYAMTDEQIGEIYALARESFFGGQQTFQVQALPFHMTPLNMARHRTNPHMAFWKMLKEGYDHFEVTRLEPKVNVCDRRYVFDAEPVATRPGATPAPLRFSAAARCPVYQVNPEIAAAAAEKSKRDEIEMAELAHRGTPVAPIRTGADGGMHPVFQAALHPRTTFDTDGGVRNIFDSKAPGTIPATVNPPKPVDPKTGVAPGTPASGGYGLASAGAKPVAAQPPASGGPRVADSGNFFTRLFSSDGDKPAAQAPTGSLSNEKKAPARPASKPAQVAAPKAAPAAAPAAHADPKAAPPPQYAAAKPLPPAGEPPPKPSDAGLFSSQPIAPTGSFDNRWGTGR